ncbi:MAG: hypothetical protein WKF54_03430 [Nocardioidaceae bacterium]
MNDLENRLRSAMHDETSDLAARPTLADDMVARGTTVRRRRRVAGGVAALALLAALVPVWQTIDTSSDDFRPVGPPTVTTPSIPSTPIDTTPDSRPVWSTRAVDVANQASGSTRVVNLRVGRHSTYDRVVVDMAGVIPGYHITYVPRFIPPEGSPIPLPGQAVLSIQLRSARTHTNRGQSLFIGQQNETYGLQMLGGSTYSDYEGYVTFGLGLSSRTPFRVFELSSPTRLVIDLHH